MSVQAQKPIFRIYEGMACLELESRDGGKWWDQGMSLGYTAVPIRHIPKVRYGMIMGEGRYVLAAFWEGQWVAINLPRSDVFALKAKGLWPDGLAAPYDTIDHYTPPPVRI